MNRIFVNFISLVSLFLIVTSCGSSEDDPAPICESPPSVSIVSTTPTSTCDGQNGEIEVNGTGGTAPLEFSIDDTTFQQSTTFTNLEACSYIVTVRDAEGCTNTNTVEAVVAFADSDLNASSTITEDTECVGGNGIIEVNATGGSSPYEFDIGNGFSGQSTFSGLAAGDYQVIVRDAEGCTFTVNVSVNQGDTNTSYANDIEPIMLASCAIPGCHNGDNGEGNWTNFSEVQDKAEEIKTRTQDGSMPQTGSITDAEIALIACWVDEGAKDN